MGECCMSARAGKKILDNPMRLFLFASLPVHRSPAHPKAETTHCFSNIPFPPLRQKSLFQNRECISGISKPPSPLPSALRGPFSHFPPSAPFGLDFGSLARGKESEVGQAPPPPLSAAEMREGGGGGSSLISEFF